MAESRDDHLTLLMQAWGRGDDGAAEALIPLVYADLRGVAHRVMDRSLAEGTYRSGDMIHEALEKMGAAGHLRMENRWAFFGLAAKAMRSALVDHLRRKGAAKRGGQLNQVPLEIVIESHQAEGLGVDELIGLTEAIDQLRNEDAELAEIVERRYFAGLSIAELCDMLGLSKATVDRRLRIARMRLRVLLGGPADDHRDSSDA